MQAISYGPEALSLGEESGEVLAVVSGAVYLLTSGGRVVGLVDARAPDSPLGARVRGFEAFRDHMRARSGAPFTGDGGGILIADEVWLSLAGARQWSPALPRIEASGKALGEGISELCGAISTFGLEEGLGQVALVAADLPGAASSRQPGFALGLSGPALKRAVEPVEALFNAWERGNSAAAGNAGLRLLGLGPGLTPSGDDLLAGLLAVCKWGSNVNGPFAGPGRALAETVLHEAPRRTTRLSARILAHAAEGLLYEPAMALGMALFAGLPAETEQAASRLFAIGHTSGVDMAAGIALGAILLRSSLRHGRAGPLNL